MKTQAASPRLPRITFWRAVFVALMAAGAYATFVRFTRGLGGSTNLSDAFPWGVWIGFDVLVGVGLAAGGFVISAVVHVFGVKSYESMARPAVLTAFMGYLLVSTALAFDIGQPWRIWHPLVMWNPHSVMFEVAWCVMLYTSVLTIEFSPMVFERLGWQRPLRLVRALYTPFVIAGVLLSMMHQSSLGTVFLIVPDKLHGLWYTPWLPVFFFLTAVAAGLSMTIVESHLSMRAFGHRLDDRLLEGAARVLVVLLGVYALWKVEDLFARGNLGLVFRLSQESAMFWLEMGMGVLLPMVLFAVPAVRRNPQARFVCALMTVLGFVVNRLNVSLTGMLGASGARYFPSWMELAVTCAMVAVGFAGFALAVKYLAVFEHGHAPASPAATVAPRPATINGRGLLALWGLVGVGAALVLLAGRSTAATASQPAHPATAAPRPASPPPELSLPDTFTFPKGENSPGEVSFCHESHQARLADAPRMCATCHASGFSLRRSGKALAGAVTMERMQKGELCGACHNGKQAFALDDCASCHM
jgi:c(7)-type cytochrome triheme protein